MGPRTVLAEKNIAIIVSTNVNVVATSPVGGQHGCVYLFDCKVFLVLL